VEQDRTDTTPFSKGCSGNSLFVIEFSEGCNEVLVIKGTSMVVLKEQLKGLSV